MCAVYVDGVVQKVQNLLTCMNIGMKITTVDISGGS